LLCSETVTFIIPYNCQSSSVLLQLLQLQSCFFGFRFTWAIHQLINVAIIQVCSKSINNICQTLSLFLSLSRLVRRSACLAVCLSVSQSICTSLKPMKTAITFIVSCPVKTSFFVSNVSVLILANLVENNLQMQVGSESMWLNTELATL